MSGECFSEEEGRERLFEDKLVVIILRESGIERVDCIGDPIDRAVSIVPEQYTAFSDTFTLPEWA